MFSQARVAFVLMCVFPESKSHENGTKTRACTREKLRHRVRISNAKNAANAPTRLEICLVFKCSSIHTFTNLLAKT